MELKGGGGFCHDNSDENSGSVKTARADDNDDGSLTFLMAILLSAARPKKR